MKHFRKMLSVIWKGKTSDQKQLDSAILSATSHRIPLSLLNLIKTSAWPGEGSSVTNQEFQPIVKSDLVKKISPEDTKLILHAPPFHTIQEEVRCGGSFWTHTLTNPDEIDYSKAVIIADFGAGSDSVVILYYSGENEPSVKYLKWSGWGAHLQHTWSHIDDNFDFFAHKIGLLGNLE